MKSAQGEEDVARDDESRVGRASRGEGGERVVARDVRVYHVNFFIARDARELQRASDVERVAEGHRVDVARRERVEFVAERRVVRERSEDFVAARGEAAREVCEASFAPAPRARRTDLEKSHHAFRSELLKSELPPTHRDTED